MSHSPSARSSSHNAPKEQGQKMEQNCKVYVSNINRAARDEQIRDTFDKFGKITYFAMKRKPQDVVYAFIEYSTYQEANEAVTKMDKTLFMKRVLNVKFGRGGKHQQRHYETLSLLPPKNRSYNSKDRSDRERRSSSSGGRYENGRKLDKITRRGSRSPPRNYQRSRKDYRDQRPKQVHRDDRRRQNSRDRADDHHQSRRKHYDKDYRKDEKRYPEKYSPQRGQRRLYGDEKYPQRKNDDKRRNDEREVDSYKRKEKSGHEDYDRKNKNRHEEERIRRSPDNYERTRERYVEQSHHRRQRNKKQRSQSPRKDKYSRSHRERQEQRRPYDDRYRHPQRKDREDLQRGRQRDRQTKRSRSREKTKSHRRDRYQLDSTRRQGHRYERENSRGRKSPRSPKRYRDEDRKRKHSRSEDRKIKHSRSEDRKRRNSRSYSPYRAPEEKRYHERNQPMNPSYRNNDYRRYPHPYVRNPKPYENDRELQRTKVSEPSMGPSGYRKNSRVSRQSKSRSQEKPQLIVEESDKNIRFSTEKEISPRPNGNSHLQSNVQDQGDY